MSLLLLLNQNGVPLGLVPGELATMSLTDAVLNELGMLDRSPFSIKITERAPADVSLDDNPGE